jgi:cytochrome c553
MSLRAWSASVLSAAALAVVSLTSAAPAAAAGDAARGKEIGYTCLGCHGIETYKNAYPTYSVPKLRGQNHEYIVAALKEYRSGQRPHATMNAHATTLSDQDMLDVAAFLGGEELKPLDLKTDAIVGKPPASLAVCVACHGQDGKGIMGIYPTLRGQHADYTERVLNDYISGSRRNGIMAPFASQLKPGDVREIARFFERQRPGLQTVPLKER